METQNTTEPQSLAGEAKAAADKNKQIFLRLPVPEYPHPIIVQVELTDDIRLHLATLPKEQVKLTVANLVMNLLQEALGAAGIAIGALPGEEPEKKSLIIPG